MSEEVEAEILEAAGAIRIRIKEPPTFDSEEEEHQATLEALKNVEKAYKDVVQALVIKSQIEELEEALSDPTYMGSYPDGRRHKEADLEALKEQLRKLSQPTGITKPNSYTTTLPTVIEIDDTKLIKGIMQGCEDMRKNRQDIGTVKINVSKRDKGEPIILDVGIDISALPKHEERYIDVEGEVISDDDKAVYDTVCQLHDDNDLITDLTIAKHIWGDVKHVSDTALAAIRGSMQKLNRIYVKVDVKPHLEAWGHDSSGFNELREVAQLLAYKSLESVLVNGAESAAYHLYETPTLRRYARKLKQIRFIPKEMLETPGRNSREYIAVKRYIAVRVTGMKHTKNGNMARNKGWNTLTIESIERRLQTRQTSPLSAKQKRTIRDNAVKYLDELTKKGEIKDYKIDKKGGRSHKRFFIIL